jgi:hypothetical protein
MPVKRNPARFLKLSVSGLAATSAMAALGDNVKPR